MIDLASGSFCYLQSARVVYGPGAVREAGLEVRRAGARRAVLITDRVLRGSTDIAARAERALAGLLAGVWDRVVPDATADSVDEAAAAARALGADAIVSIGGGSAIDTAKGVAVCLTIGGGIRDHQGTQFLGRRATPHVAIPTTAGTGSEVSMYAVIKDAAASVKLHYCDDNLIPHAAILDPELCVGLPPALTAGTAMDALTHAIESYTSVGASAATDPQAIGAARLIARHLPAALDRPADLEARGALLVAAYLAGAAMSNAGVGLTHAIAHVVGARFAVHHGTANGIVLPHVLRFNHGHGGLAARHRDLALALGADAAGVTDRAAGERAAGAVAALLGRTPLPARLRDAGVPEDALPALAEAALSDAAIVFNGRPVADAGEVLAVLREAY